MNKINLIIFIKFKIIKIILKCEFNVLLFGKFNVLKLIRVVVIVIFIDIVILIIKL